MTRLFVYGTLKRGQARHDLLVGARYLGEARAKGYAIFDAGDYPMMKAGTEGEVAHGELYEVEDLASIDRWEDHPNTFVRAPITLEDGSSAIAYLYARLVPAHAPRVAAWARISEA